MILKSYCIGGRTYTYKACVSQLNLFAGTMIRNVRGEGRNRGSKERRREEGGQESVLKYLDFLSLLLGSARLNALENA